MSVTPEELASSYPRLYHMAERDSWSGIRRHGLLSTQALLNLYEIPDEVRAQVLCCQRTSDTTIEHPAHGKAIIRDQKPLHRSKLEGALHGCSFLQWLELLNSRVFLWLSRDRLKTLMCAREYCDRAHLVLVLDTLRLASDFRERITLAPMNTGNTRPFAHPRGPSTFSRMGDYPFQERLRLGLYYTVVEFAVEHGIPNVMDYILEAKEMRCSSCEKKEKQGLVAVRTLFPV